MGKSLIEWTDRVWNPVTGCGPGLQCYERCYARRFAMRLAGRYGYPADDPFRVTFHPDRLDLPLRWKPCRVFVDSMGDLFHDDVSTDVLDRTFAVMGRAFWHTFQILTKRPENALGYMNDPDTPHRVQGVLAAPKFDRMTYALAWPPKNVWLGVSVEDQRAADERIPPLLETRVAVRFVSCEPLLGPVDLASWLDPWRGVDGYTERCIHDGLLNEFQAASLRQPTLSWVVAGGENGPGARPCHPDWLRSLRDQCVGAKVPFYFKGYGAWRPADNVVEILDPKAFVFAGSESVHMVKHGTYPHDQLDGRQWKQMPGKEDAA